MEKEKEEEIVNIQNENVLISKEEKTEINNYNRMTEDDTEISEEYRNKSKIDELNEKIARRLNHEIEQISSNQEEGEEKKEEKEKDEDEDENENENREFQTNKESFILSNIKNNISLSDISRLELQFGSLQCSGKNVENRTYYIDDGNT